ncbi:hypothetical protein OOC_00955 [Providencia rettgeri Dmel1]|nr:hypothetical protein OOC_00955 [Providencia rettgeri Dmel1]
MGHLIIEFNSIIWLFCACEHSFLAFFDDLWLFCGPNCVIFLLIKIENHDLLRSVIDIKLEVFNLLNL